MAGTSSHNGVGPGDLVLRADPASAALTSPLFVSPAHDDRAARPRPRPRATGATAAGNGDVATTGSEPPATSRMSRTAGHRGTTVRLPFLTVHLELTAPSAPAPSRLRIGPVGVPTPGRVARYLGLGVLVGVELVEWPVALAVAAASRIVDRAWGTARTASGSGHATSVGTTGTTSARTTSASAGAINARTTSAGGRAGVGVATAHTSTRGDRPAGAGTGRASRRAAPRAR
ncbi:hypothetical protein [Frankia sp. AiPa1]|uniref:hypothetical protein n=1 Tax=Frankia sp. AiPa1 TaxID=573492 RepID=UPI00202AD3CB|nr:hypothetical protein [Frankia sp. AiPa1]MCL9761462.1 hypothetical protein [Frankia sp. AiPa1]